MNSENFHLWTSKFHEKIQFYLLSSQIWLTRVINSLKSTNKSWLRRPNAWRFCTRRIVQTSSWYAPSKLPSTVLQHVPASTSVAKQLGFPSTWWKYKINSGKRQSSKFETISNFFCNFSQMPGFGPHLSNLELIRQAGIFYPRITDLTGKHNKRTNVFKYWFLIISLSHLRFQSTSNYNIVVNRYRLRIICIFNFHTWLKRRNLFAYYPSFLQSIQFSNCWGRGWWGAVIDLQIDILQFLSFFKNLFNYLIDN